MKEQTVVELNGNSEKRSFPAGPGLYVPHALFDHLMGDLLRPLAKVQSLGSGNLLFAIRMLYSKFESNLV